jgi:hypothetical protein
MVHATLHKDLRLSRKFAMRVTELLYKEMKKERLRMPEVIVAMITGIS